MAAARAEPGATPALFAYAGDIERHILRIIHSPSR